MRIVNKNESGVITNKYLTLFKAALFLRWMSLLKSIDMDMKRQVKIPVFIDSIKNPAWKYFYNIQVLLINTKMAHNTQMEKYTSILFDNNHTIYI